MPTKIYWIHSFTNDAKIGIMPRPRGGDWLEDEIVFLKRQKVTLLVSLLEVNEIMELGLKDEEALCIKYGIKFIHFPIVDRSTPVNANGFIQKLFDSINDGANIVIHCRMGIGRSSIIAGAVLTIEGYNADEILERIGKVRGLSVPDTEAQVVWLRNRIHEK
ncbi:dual specificity protein phosphatase-like protein [Chitinophaga skermanii]|uniref:Dual specificity protein phosphatase-like protein n=1 Tax=Chitinophaga skermanii TaxID=331697 RepID=A0A327Q823_9BACT|nr:dual specificity protein phosphatase family protein [Chitinophaga skermanii]RAI99851.1 dual specificity protein phosphatase-like protein [Chitinophaga skermanii]